ncbi:sulfatase [Streptomyces sp. NPDC001970]
MSLWTHSQLPDQDSTVTEESPPRYGSPHQLPDDGAADRNTAGRTAAADHEGDAPGGGVRGGRRKRSPGAARALTRCTTILAALLVHGALLLPDELPRLVPAAFTRIPVEAVFGTAVLLVLKPKPRQVAAVVAGAGLGLLTVLKLLDMGFHSALDRPFDPLLDWTLLDDAEAFLRDSAGATGAIVAAIGGVVLVLAVLVLMTLAVVRLSHLVVRRSAAATRGTLLLGTVWLICASLGAQIAAVPLASRGTAELAQEHVRQVRAGLKDRQAFSEAAAVDAFRGTRADQLLTGLRGKDVLFVFIESYGRSAVQDPRIAPHIGAVLADGTRRLRAAGFSSRSAFLTSPTSGGGSWLAHSTFMSGLWIKNQQRYDSLTSSDRLTLTGAFRDTGAWRTVGVMPGVTRSWPEGEFYGLDQVYDSRNLGYQGPKFSWSPIPDQYSLAAFERLEHGKPDHRPLMAEIVLVSSHSPWAPIPRTLGWDEMGDGSVYHSVKRAGNDPEDVWKDPAQVRAEYGRAVAYSLASLIDYVEKYGNDDTVLLFLGDHQPVATVTDGEFGRDVPITVVARDRAALGRISGWGWQEGLKPGPGAPVWRMDTFRDRFLTAYGPGPGAAPPPTSR